MTYVVMEKLCKLELIIVMMGIKIMTMDEAVIVR